MLARLMLSNLRTSEIASLGFLALASAGAVLRVVAAFRLRSHLRGTGGTGRSTAPVTLWRAVKRGLRDLDDKLERLAASGRDGDQILLGADSGSEELAACEKLRAHFPQRDITIVPCELDRAANPKISKFIQMQPHARHEHWLITDSEALLDVEFVEHLRSEWSACDADAMTAGYRFRTAQDDTAQILDALPALTTLWPGLMLAPRIDFTLGGCTALRAGDLRALGGWEIFSDDLAEDHRLGQLLVRAGKRIALSRRVLVLDSDYFGMAEMLRHQHRVAVTYRCAAPLGALGLPLLHCWPLLLAGVSLASPWHSAGTPLMHAAFLFSGKVIAASSVIAAAWTMATLAIARMLGERTHIAVVAPLATFVEFACWVAAWFSGHVWWAGKWRRVGWRGRLTM